MTRQLILIAALSFAASPSAAQQPPGEPQMQQVAENLYMLAWRGGNVGVLAGDDGVILIDDQYAPQAPGILAAIREVSDRPLRFVLNTHWHGDHTGGNEPMAEAGALIVAHDNVRTRLEAGQLMPFFDREVPPASEGALPIVTFSDSVTLYVNGEVVHAFHVPPAHTDGDAVVHFRNADVIHAGDLYFNGIFPFIDTGSGGRVAGVIGAADRMLDLCGPQTRVIPGHGPLSDCAGLTAYRDMLTVVHERIAKLIAGGATADEVVAARPAADYADAWGQGFLPEERWVRMLFENMTAR